ncbi:hypothetical protein SPBR_06659 [Sporothrix brasiliensis 5110]|uniref:Partial AB-hydrolase lipase domain-containing protein n=1 Tax=Sporothrix brasiliensis 5110 TaxID=1398154 RepID=A0A0C2EPL8_9PEZI|nr:uncharacterized protein SPBR_06659 [Sporothrix brasiliensis 5110]KIH88179.1 hypothetical protein SPBR_06659 [Sporothrix brasiliensis 5110]
MVSEKPRPDGDPPAQQRQQGDSSDDAHSPLLLDETLAQTAVEFVKQSEKLSLQNSDNEPPGQSRDMAVEARFVTPQDPVIVTADGNRLPPVPLSEAHKLNILKDELQGKAQVLDEKASANKATKPEKATSSNQPPHGAPDQPGPASSSEKLLDIGQKERQKKAKRAKQRFASPMQRSAEGTLQRAMPPSHTNPLFPPLPLYGPPSILRNLQSTTFRVTSFFLSLSFLSVIVLGSLFTSIPGAFRRMACRLTLRDPDANRPLYAEEKRRAKLRRDVDRNWRRQQRRQRQRRDSSEDEDPAGAGVGDVTYTPAAGGPDPLVPDVAHYARRVGLDVEAFEVQTEDGFLIDLWHIVDPNEDTPRPSEARKHRGPGLLFDETTKEERAATEQAMLNEPRTNNKKPKFPVLLVHGLLQSAGAYCVGDDDSLAFYLCKAGYDVWLGNNRCGFQPRHTVLHPSDPRMWCWNIRQMGVFDLPALASRVLRETRFAHLGLVCHSQGTTEALVALAKEQRPDLGEALTVFCALAPAVYAGRLIGKMYFKFMRVISPAMFRIMFGIHSFIPLMMQVHPLLPGRLYGWLGYRVFSFLFEWTDARWDRGLRDRMFQFSPVYVSAESMRWWLGREGFARHKCILATKEEWRREEAEADAAAEANEADEADESDEASPAEDENEDDALGNRVPGSSAWYDERVPPFALWVCGRDDLVDGRRLLRRFLPRPVFAALERGQGSRSTSSGIQRSLREPHVRVVHAKVIPEYEHLDVIWAMDAVDEVFSEVRDVLWKTCNVRNSCRVPRGCETVEAWDDPARQWRLKSDGGGMNDEDTMDDAAVGNSGTATAGA